MANIVRIAGTSLFALAVTCASAQMSGNDPYNPLTRRAAMTTQTVEPSLADMGFGTDEGNVGPFVTMTDKQYAQAMAARGIMEVQLGQTAISKTDREDVKALARRMVNDYLGWNAGMEKAAAKLGIALPKDLNERQKADLNRLSALSGPAFDQAYLREVIHLQTKALTMSHHEAAEAGVAGFRHWAGVVVPQIQDQIATARQALDGSGLEISRK
jgi:putative membrane protein